MKNKNEQVFHQFACCIPVMGAKRAIMYDLNRATWCHIPNDLANILKRFQGVSKADVYAQFDSANHVILDTYFHFLEEREFIFYTPLEQRDCFPTISTKWDYPAKINNAILDIGSDFGADNVGEVLTDLETLGCNHIQLRQSDALAVLDWSTILQITRTTAIFSIDVYIPYTQYSREKIDHWVAEHKRIQNVFMYGAPKQSINYFQERAYGNLICVTQSLFSDVFIQDPAYFTVNRSLYTESLRYNNYLNRKLYIDSLGNIKNAPEQEVIFGNIHKDKLADVINMQSFKSLWKIHKDMLLVCNDCEYRYMCVDNRIPVKVPNSEMWCFCTSCAYNPYIAKWKNEPGFIPANPTFKNKSS